MLVSVVISLVDLKVIKNQNQFVQTNDANCNFGLIPYGAPHGSSFGSLSFILCNNYILNISSLNA